jgi:hypothetical protein
MTTPSDDRDSTGPPASPTWADDDTQIIGVAQVPGERTAEDTEPPDELPHIDPAELAGLQGDPATATGIRRVLPLEDEASNLVARYLFPTERYRGEWKRHHIHLLGPMLIGAAATFVLGWLSGFLHRM